MELKKPVLQIVGFQNSGKTTLVTKIAEALSQNGIRVGTLKHHGHGGIPDAYDQGKDTFKHRQAGATVTGVEGEGMLQLHAFNCEGWQLHDLLFFYEQLPIDIILIEGFKKASFPKIVLLRSEEDEQLVEKLDHIVLMICWYKNNRSFQVPTAFHIDDDNDYLAWIQSYLKGKI